MGFKFERHKEMEGKHAFLSASQSSWLRYKKVQLVDRFYTSMAAAEGTRLHSLASELIELGIKLPKTPKTLHMYVNDCIGYGMQTEVMLMASRNAFGTADAIQFDAKKKLLRIFDLKTGIKEAKFDQLVVYAAFFCHEYGFMPAEIDIELRLYQNDECRTLSTTNSDDSGYPDQNLLERVMVAMDIIESHDQVIESLRRGVVPDDINMDDIDTEYFDPDEDYI